MNTFRLFAYLGFCTGSIWLCTNTPIGEWAIKYYQLVKIPPATYRSPATEAAHKDKVINAYFDSSRNRDHQKQKKIDLDEYFAQVAASEQRQQAELDLQLNQSTTTSNSSPQLTTTSIPSIDPNAKHDL